MPTSPPETRPSLIVRLRDAEDALAWEEFVSLYGPAVWRVARRRGLQASDADNLVQEVLLAVAQSVSQWVDRPDRGSFRGWLFRIARNESVDMMTRRATRSLGQDGETALRMLDGLQDSDDVNSMIQAEYEEAVFRRAAASVRQSVSPQTWKAFWLTHVDGLSIEQAAEQLETRPGTIYVARSRVMARIKDMVRQYEESDD